MHADDYDIPDEHFGPESDCIVHRASEQGEMFNLDNLKVHTVLVRKPGVKSSALPRIASARDVYNLVRHDYAEMDREFFLVLLMDVRHKLIGIQEAGIGTVAGVDVTPRETFKAAVVSGASAMIVVHNHPSGDATPSQQDLELTARLKESANLLGINLLDHVVIGHEGYTSIMENRSGR